VSTKAQLAAVTTCMVASFDCAPASASSASGGRGTHMTL
jgi:hypothetical protein